MDRLKSEVIGLRSFFNYAFACFRLNILANLRIKSSTTFRFEACFCNRVCISCTVFVYMSVVFLQIEFLDRERRQRQRVEDISARVGKPAPWVAAKEQQIRSKIEPLMSQAEVRRFSFNLSLVQCIHSLHSPLQVEVNADLLSEMILKELVDDVSSDLQRMGSDREAVHEAQRLRDLPDLETVMQRLDDMEVG